MGYLEKQKDQSFKPTFDNTESLNSWPNIGDTVIYRLKMKTEMKVGIIINSGYNDNGEVVSRIDGENYLLKDLYKAKQKKYNRRKLKS